MTSAWAFAVAAWDRPGVEAICLDLQDVHGQCPSLLLWRLWTLHHKREVHPETLATAVQIARDWEDGVVHPLRAVRRRLKAPAPRVPPTACVALRRQIAAAELEAERALLEALEALAAEPGTGDTPPLLAITALARTWRSPPPVPALSRLVAAF